MSYFDSPYDGSKLPQPRQSCGCWTLIFIGAFGFWLMFIYWFVVVRPASRAMSRPLERARDELVGASPLIRAST